MEGSGWSDAREVDLLVAGGGQRKVGVDERAREQLLLLHVSKVRLTHAQRHLREDAHFLPHPVGVPPETYNCKLVYLVLSRSAKVLSSKKTKKMCVNIH